MAGMEEALQDYQNLVKAKPELRISKLVGCRAVDWGTYSERLKAFRRGRKSPFQMLNDPEDKEYLEGKAKKLNQKVYNILGLYAGLVPSFRPLHAKYLCHRYHATSVLDFSAGWGGRMLGAVSLGCRYVGIDTNHDLKDGYERLIELSKGDITMVWQPAETVDFTKMDYDFILTSPPFDNLEIYQNQPNYKDWQNEFLLPVVSRAFSSLKIGGWMALCIPENLARAISEKIGSYHETVSLPIRSRIKGANRKLELVYCWNKN